MIAPQPALTNPQSPIPNPGPADKPDDHLTDKRRP